MDLLIVVDVNDMSQVYGDVVVVLLALDVDVLTDLLVKFKARAILLFCYQ
jgi:hypothetical protein